MVLALGITGTTIGSIALTRTQQSNAAPECPGVGREYVYYAMDNDGNSSFTILYKNDIPGVGNISQSYGPLYELNNDVVVGSIYMYDVVYGVRVPYPSSRPFATVLDVVLSIGVATENDFGLFDISGVCSIGIATHGINIVPSNSVSRADTRAHSPISIFIVNVTSSYADCWCIKGVEFSYFGDVRGTRRVTLLNSV